MKRVRIDKNIEKSTVAGSTPITDSANELNYVAPGTLGQQLEINASGLPEYKSTLTTLKTVNRAFSKVGSGQATNNDSINNSDAIYHSGNTTIGTTTNVAKLDIYQDLGGNNINPIVVFRDSINRVSIYQRLPLGAYSQSVLAGDTAILSDENLANNNGLVVGKHNGATIRFGTSNAKGLGLFARDIATPDMFIASSGNVLIKKTTDSGENFQVNGTAVFSGSVGIGTNIQTVKLAVFDNSSGNLIWARNTINAFGIFLGTNATSSYISGDNTDLVFQRNGTEIARIHSYGLGIGTSTPDVNTMLDIASTTRGSRPFPSMTQAQRTSLNAATPVGTHVYQTDGTEGVYVKKSGGWIFAY